MYVHFHDLTVCLLDVLLTSVQPEFQHGDYTFKDCLLLHCLLVKGQVADFCDKIHCDWPGCGGVGEEAGAHHVCALTHLPV